MTGTPRATQSRISSISWATQGKGSLTLMLPPSEHRPAHDTAVAGTSSPRWTLTTTCGSDRAASHEAKWPAETPASCCTTTTGFMPGAASAPASGDRLHARFAHQVREASAHGGDDAVGIESALPQQQGGVAVVDEVVRQPELQHRVLDAGGRESLQAGAAGPAFERLLLHRDQRVVRRR